MRIGLALAMACLATGPIPAFAQQVPAPSAVDEAPEDQGRALTQAFSRGDYRAALDLLERLESQNLSPMLRSQVAQIRPAFDGFVVVDPGSPMAYRAAEEEETSRLAQGQPRDAVAAIVERARDTRIVIINETHDNPRDRAFVLALAEALHPLGFTHYAAETLRNCCTPEQSRERMAALAARAYPLVQDGFYSNEPMFGYLLRRVLELGFEPVAYEWTPDFSRPIPQGAESIAVREAAQAESLARAIADADPEARFLIHVGYSHAAEQPITRENVSQEWMAAQLKRLTGIDPLTVDQTGMSEFSRPQLHAGLADLAQEGPVILFADGQPLATGFNAVLMDLQVLHPPIDPVGGRPDWLARTGRRAVPVPLEMMPREGNRLVQVFAANDTQGAVPIDQVLVQAGQEPPLLYVPRVGDLRWQAL